MPKATGVLVMAGRTSFRSVERWLEFCRAIQGNYSPTGSNGRLPGIAEDDMFRLRRNARAARGTAGTDDGTMTARLDLLSAILAMSPRLPRNDR
jgi:hypothetical protein